MAAIGAPGLHFHDLRSPGTRSRSARLSLRDVMAPMGHDSPRAALIYQHASAEADRGIADAIEQAVKAAGASRASAGEAGCRGQLTGRRGRLMAR